MLFERVVFLCASLGQRSHSFKSNVLRNWQGCTVLLGRETNTHRYVFVLYKDIQVNPGYQTHQVKTVQWPWGSCTRPCPPAACSACQPGPGKPGPGPWRTPRAQRTWGTSESRLQPAEEPCAEAEQTEPHSGWRARSSSAAATPPGKNNCKLDWWLTSKPFSLLVAGRAQCFNNNVIVS